MVFETERLKFRYLEKSDSETMFEIYSDIEAMKYRANKPFTTISEAEEMINQTITDYELGLKFRFAIVKKETNELIGTILYFVDDLKSDICSIGYSLGKTYWKQGFAIETLNGLIEYLRIQKFNKIQAKVFKMNTDSINLLNKATFNLDIENQDEKLFTFNKNI